MGCDRLDRLLADNDVLAIYGIGISSMPTIHQPSQPTVPEQRSSKQQQQQQPAASSKQQQQPEKVAPKKVKHLQYTTPTGVVRANEHTL